MICICTALGMHAEFFFPTGSGRTYAMSPYLETIKDFRDDFTVFSGLAHPGNEAGGHNSERTFLSAARNPELPGFHNSISLDQFVADHIGTATRFPSLTLATAGSLVPGLAVNRSGVSLPAEQRPSKVFAQLFLQGSADEVKREEQRLAEGRSVLDALGEQAKQLEALGRRRRSCQARRVFHQRPRDGAEASGDSGLVAQAETQGRDGPADRRAEHRRSDRQNGCDCSTCFRWPCKPTARGSSRCSSANMACRRFRA